MNLIEELNDIIAKEGHKFLALHRDYSICELAVIDSLYKIKEILSKHEHTLCLEFKKAEGKFLNDLQDGFNPINYPDLIFIFPDENNKLSNIWYSDKPESLPWLIEQEQEIKEGDKVVMKHAPMPKIYTFIKRRFGDAWIYDEERCDYHTVVFEDLKIVKYLTKANKD